MDESIDYDAVFASLEKEKELSMQFLKDALNSSVDTNGPTDAFDALNVKMWQNLIEMWESDKNIKNMINNNTIKVSRFQLLLKCIRYYIPYKLTWGQKHQHYKRKYKDAKRCLS